MKQCKRCLKRLNKTEFHKHNQRKDGLQSICKICRNTDDRNRYISGSKTKQRRLKVAVNVTWINKLKQDSGCKYCHENDPIVLDFHHINQETKSYCVSKILNRDQSTILKEIEKCDIVCANCHRRIHAGTIKPD